MHFKWMDIFYFSFLPWLLTKSTGECVVSSFQVFYEFMFISISSHASLFQMVPHCLSTRNHKFLCFSDMLTFVFPANFHYLEHALSLQNKLIFAVWFFLINLLRLQIGCSIFFLPNGNNNFGASDCNLKQWVLVGSPKPLSVEKDKPLVVCFGEMLIDFVPSAAGVSLAEAHAFKKAAGGAPANVAVGIARLGGSSAFIGKV